LPPSENAQSTVVKHFRRSLGAEVGFWAMSDLRLGAGYNFSQVNRADDFI
jgi:hypothetical protein